MAFRERWRSRGAAFERVALTDLTASARDVVVAIMVGVVDAHRTAPTAGELSDPVLSRDE